MRTYLQAAATDELVSWQSQLAAAEKFQVSLSEVEAEILKAGLLPARYQRNRRMITITQQQQLFNSTVLIIGAGGLGGHVLEQLARLGVGELHFVDGDVFVEHNLNRQLHALPQHLGQPKVEIVAERLRQVNPAVKSFPFYEMLTDQNAVRLISPVDCVVDATDNVATRLLLEKACKEQETPLVHAAIAGWYGHVATVLPGDDNLSKIYSNWDGGRGIEEQLGTPAFTPAVAASLEVCEVCKLLLDLSGVLKNRQLLFDLQTMEFNEALLD